MEGRAASFGCQILGCAPDILGHERTFFERVVAIGESKVKQCYNVATEPRGVVGDTQIVDLDVVVADTVLVQPVHCGEQLLKVVAAQGVAETDLHGLVKFGHDEHRQRRCQKKLVKVDDVGMPPSAIVANAAVGAVDVDLLCAGQLLP